MVTGPLRTVLWILGGLAIVWAIAGLAMLPSMGRMMGGCMMGEGGMMGEGMMMGMGGMTSMMTMMLAQGLAMLGLLGVFVYLVVDSARRRRG